MNDLFLDKRALSEMPFGEGAPDREDLADRVREMLDANGVRIADDINRLGCTGAVALHSVEDAQMLRMGLAGGGVGLPCFVPSDRFCLVHNTIGGLETGQKQYHEENVDRISRELTAQEQGRVILVNAARKAGRKDANAAADILMGLDGGAVVEEETLRSGAVPAGGEAWECSEHRKTVWSCRYCVAQALVEGQLTPPFLLHETYAAENKYIFSSGDNVIDVLDDSDDSGAASGDLYVRVATFRRKLARD